MIAQVDLINGIIRMSLTNETIAKFSLDESDVARINSELSDVSDKVNDGSIEEDSNHTTWDFYESNDCTQDRYSVTDVEYTAYKILQKNQGNSSTVPPGLMSTALGIHNQQGASQNLKNNLGNPFSKIDDILGQDTEKKTDERDDAIDKVRDVANTGLKIGKSSRGELAEVVLRLYELDDLCYAIPGTRLVIVERKKANNRAGSNEFYTIEEIIENTPTYLVLSNCNDETAPRKVLYSDMRQDSMNGTAMLKHEALEIGDLMDIHLLKVEQKPINKLMSLFDEEEKEEPIDVNDTHLSKLDSLFSDDEETSTNEEIDEKEEETEEDSSDNVNKIDELLSSVEEKADYKTDEKVEEKTEPKISYAAQMIAESMGNMNADKIAELKERIEEKQRDIKKYQYEAKLSEQRAKQAEADLDVLYSRLGQMEPKKPANGYGFMVGTMNEENASMEVIIVRAADTYTADDFKNTVLTDDIKKELTDLGLELSVSGLGESTWKQPGIDDETLAKLKSGVRISLKGKFKVYHELKLDLTKAGFVHDGNLENYINKKKEQLCSSIQTGSSEMDNEIRQSLGLFDTLNDVSPMGGANTQTGANTVMPFGNPYTTQPVKVGDNSTQVNLNVNQSDDEDESKEFANDEFIFAIIDEPTATNDLGDPQISICITPKSYWLSENCQYDQHIGHLLNNKYAAISALGDRFEELCESTFALNDTGNYQTAKHMGINDVIDTMCKSGLMLCKDFQDFISQKDTQNAVNIATQMGHQSMIC